MMDGLIYAYHAPKSTSQQAYTQARVAQLTAQRREGKPTQEFTLQPPSLAAVQRTTSHDSFNTLRSPIAEYGFKRRDVSQESMDVPRAITSSSGSSAQSDNPHQSLLDDPFEIRHGRRYIRHVPYPMPCDLPEIQRQTLRTLLACQVFGQPICSPSLKGEWPRKVLEIGCGSGFWSAMCHDYLCSLGAQNVSFTGLDVAPLAPDLTKQGVDWTFVQHDFRRLPLPFNDGEFDLVMLKDLSLTTQLGTPFQKFLDESIRVLREGGTLEIWESDHVFRSILPHTPPLHSKEPDFQQMADRTGTFLMAPGTPFAPAHNKYLVAANRWIQEALDRRKLPATPCTRIAQILFQEPDHLQDIGVRRIAVPLGGLRWERDGATASRSNSLDPTGHFMTDGAPKRRQATGALSDEQNAALRHGALMTVLQMIENMEPLLREISGKSTEEWAHWWASMMSNLMDPAKASLNGECLEMGAWWATKVSTDSDDDF